MYSLLGPEPLVRLPGGDVNVVTAVLKLPQNLARANATKKPLLDAGVGNAVIDGMWTYYKDEHAAQWGCGAIWSLAFCK